MKHKMNLEDEKDFYNAINDLIASPYVQCLRTVQQHGKESNRYDHSMYVAYTSYKLCKKFGLDARTAARGAILHDFELLDERQQKPNKLIRFFVHPRYAVQHASQTFSLSEKEKDIIEKHMWPATLHRIPKYKESMVVCMVDTYCATIEFLGVFNKVENEYSVGLEKVQ